jgi:hypothetical protein
LLVVDIAVASAMGIRQSPLLCKYCIADPMSSSINCVTCLSVNAIPSWTGLGVPELWDIVADMLFEPCTVHVRTSSGYEENMH